jgi:hypothetical protein
MEGGTAIIKAIEDRNIPKRSLKFMPRGESRVNVTEDASAFIMDMFATGDGLSGASGSQEAPAIAG